MELLRTMASRPKNRTSVIIMSTFCLHIDRLVATLDRIETKWRHSLTFPIHSYLHVIFFKRLSLPGIMNFDDKIRLVQGLLHLSQSLEHVAREPGMVSIPGEMEFCPKIRGQPSPSGHFQRIVGKSVDENELAWNPTDLGDVPSNIKGHKVEEKRSVMALAFVFHKHVFVMVEDLLGFCFLSIFVKIKNNNSRTGKQQKIMR